MGMGHYCGHDVIAAPGQSPKQLCFEAYDAIAPFGAMVTHARKTLSKKFALVCIAAAVTLVGTAPVFIAKGETIGGAKAATALPGYEAPGISFGEYLLKSAVSFSVAYDSNILREQSNELSDYIFYMAPSFDLMRESGKHIQEVFGSFTTAKYAHSHADDFTDINVWGRETYLLSPTSQIMAKTSIVDGYEQRTSSNHDIPTNAAEPVHYHSLQGSLGYRKSWKSIEAVTTLTASRQTYDDVKLENGGIDDQSFRNTSDFSLETYVNLQISKHIQSDLRVSAQKSVISMDIRSSDRWKLSDTIKVDLTSKTSIGFTAGVREEDYYNDPNAQMRLLYDYEAYLRWSPIHRLIFTARGGYRDLGVDFTKGITGGGEGRYGSLEFEYLIWRNLQLTSNLSYEKDHLSADQGVQTSITGQAGLTYEISPHAGVSLLYNLEHFDASSADFTSYDKNVFLGTFNFRF
jgi:hypothetical protein